MFNKGELLRKQRYIELNTPSNDRQSTLEKEIGDCGMAFMKLICEITKKNDEMDSEIIKRQLELLN